MGSIIDKAILRRHPLPLFRGLLFCALLLTQSGCNLLRTDKSHYAAIDRSIERGAYHDAIDQLELAKTTAYTAKDRVVYYLDLGMLYHWNGDYALSNEMLERAERGIEDNFSRSVSRAALSLIMNDNILSYAGEDYEDIYLNLFKALNYLALGEQDAAFVEVRRIDNKLALLEDKYNDLAWQMNQSNEARETFVAGESDFQSSALGRYLSLLLYRMEGRWDDVRIDMDKINRSWSLQPDIYTFSRPDLSRSTERLGASDARLNIMAFSGLAPDKKAKTLYIHTEENIVVLAGSAENYLGRQNPTGWHIIPWEGISEGYHFKVQLPYMEKRPSEAASIIVEVEDVATEPLQQIESLENAAISTFEIQKPLIYLKTVLRAVLKGLASEQAKKDMTNDMDESSAFIMRLIADLMVDSTENADLRVSRYFPARASVLEIHLKEGTYTVRIKYYDHRGKHLYTDERKDVYVGSGRLNLLESAYLN